MLRKIITSIAIVTFSTVTFAASQQQMTIPKAEIQKLVTSVAVINHYYIKDVPDDKLFNSAIQGMLTKLDPHSTFLDEDALKQLNDTVKGQFAGVGIEITTEKGALKVVSPIEDSPAAKAGIQPGDFIIKVGNNLVSNMSLPDAIKLIKGRPGTDVKLTILRKGENNPITMTLKRAKIDIKMVKSRILEPGFGYVRLAIFQGKAAKNVRTAIKSLIKESDHNLKGLVFDLRSNPGGLLDQSADIADLFLDANKNNKFNNLIVYTKGRVPNADIEFKAHPNDMINGVPLIVLINGGSASASEIVAGALKDYKRAVIVGTRSFGKGSVQTVIPINKDNAIKLTTALYYTPAGRKIQAQGITPNVRVPMLEISNDKAKNMVTIEEAGYRNHLASAQSKEDAAKTLKLLKAQREKEIKLAKSDYQLYESLMMLKAMNAVK